MSRDGWVIIDDSLRPRLDLNAEGSGVPWPRAPPAAALRGDGSYSDAYIFAHGRAYTAAVRDFKDLSGPIPLSPRHALGPAFSRWFQWNDVEVSPLPRLSLAHLCLHLQAFSWRIGVGCALLFSQASSSLPLRSPGTPGSLRSLNSRCGRRCPTCRFYVQHSAPLYFLLAPTCPSAAVPLPVALSVPLSESLQNIAIVQAGFADHGIPLSLLVVDMDW